MIGHLQKNKVKYTVGRARLIHSVDSLELGQVISKEALRQNEDGEWGAYCLAGAQVVFKKITILFQTDSFYVAKDTGKNGELTRYDKMVVKAKDIENRKVVS